MITYLAHTLRLVREFLVKNKTVNMPQPPYSVDLAYGDFFLFSKLKTPMKRKRFARIKEIQKKKNETGAVENTKKRISKVYRGLEKNAGIRP